MTTLIKRNGTSFPKLLTNLFDTERFFNTDFFNLGSELALPVTGMWNIPNVNVIEKEKNFMLELAAPGLQKKDFKVEIVDDMLTISVEKEVKKEEEKEGYMRKEFEFNSFSRSFRLPENSKLEKIEAVYENGILKIEIPKKEVSVSKPKKEIKIS